MPVATHTYAALLRGINVGGKNKVPMAELRTVFGALGHGQVATYIQSGNVVFTSKSTDERAIAAGIERAVAKKWGLSVPVVVRTHDELFAAHTNNAFLAGGADPARLLVVFLAAHPSAAAVATLDARRSPPDALAVRGRDVYLHCPNGFGTSKLTIDYFERRLGTIATARNWNTVTKLVALTGG